MIVTAIRTVPQLTTGWILFFVLTGWWVAFVLTALGVRPERGGVAAQVCMAVSVVMIAVLGIANAWYWLIGKPEDPAQDDAGIAQSRPPQLWTVWVIQFLSLTLLGLVTLISPQRVAELLTNSRYDFITIDVVDDSVRVLGAWIIALALFSFFALGVARDWIWQGIGWIFCAVFTLLMIATVYNAFSGEYSLWGYVYGFQGIVFVPITVALLLGRDTWSTENIEKNRQEWNMLELVMALPMLWRPLLTGRRTIHRHGILTKGYLEVLPYPTSEPPQGEGVPDNDFLVPNEKLPVMVRFSNRTQADDAALDIRGCALFAMNGAGAPFDMLFATGAYAPAGTALNFAQTLRRPTRRMVLKNDVYREGLAGGMRRAPDSFGCLSYHNQLTLEWRTPSGDHYLVRFRLVPESEASLDPGLPGQSDLRSLWKQERYDSEDRAPDYLREHLQHSLTQGNSVSFLLEAQFHKPDEDDALEWYDATLEWGARASWQRVARLVLNDVCPDSERKAFAIDPRRLPTSLRVPQPSNIASVTDPRSLGTARFNIAGGIARLRWKRCGISAQQPDGAIEEACSDSDGQSSSASP